MCFLFVCSGRPGGDAHVPRLAFSAALTVPMERAGTIVFDKTFVNEGDFYDPKTGKHDSAGSAAGSAAGSPAERYHCFSTYCSLTSY